VRPKNAPFSALFSSNLGLTPIGMGNPVEDERDSGLKPNTIPL
jgi:hypothetical protein